MSGFFAGGTWWDVSAKDYQSIQDGADRLAGCDITDALGEARRLWVAAVSDSTEYQDLIDRRASREPLSHVLGYRDFYKHRFIVTAAVLDPRPDTETLIETALTVPFYRVLDLGTGSGCIILSLLAENPNASGVGTDLSDKALAVAKQNAEKLGVTSRVSLKQSDWFDGVAGQFDLIVSNPPYIAADEMQALQPEVRDHEPRMALTDEKDGLSCYRAIIAGASGYLTDAGHLIVEIGPTQGQAVSDMMHKQRFAEIRVIQDLDGRDRVVSGQKTAS